MSDAHVIAIDGPSGSGKSTVAGLVAGILGYVHVDSGAIYRGITWQFLRDRIELSDKAGVVSALRSMDIRFFMSGNSALFTINGTALREELRSPAVRSFVSDVAAVPEVRAWVVNLLRGLVRLGNLVMEGRDIGSVVFPDTPFKFYVDASPEERARRRCAELRMANEETDTGKVLKSLTERDGKDRARATAPLVIPADAQVIDTTALSAKQVAEKIAARVRMP